MEFVKTTKSRRRVTIEDINVGEIFCCNNGTMYMKISTSSYMWDDHYLNEEDIEFIGVNLADGSLQGFERGITCSLLIKKTVIEYTESDLTDFI